MVVKIGGYTSVTVTEEVSRTELPALGIEKWEQWEFEDTCAIRAPICSSERSDGGARKVPTCS
jgi:hypothetical protein